jgi:RNA polymerase sigma factor (sigma-70 family)
MELESDPRLVELAQAGDQQAFAELYNRYFDPVYDFVARMTRNRDEAADIAQDTFLKAMHSLGGLQKGASFKGWIFTIARNTALNRLERAKRTRPLAFEDDDGEEVSFEVVDTDRFADPAEAAQANAIAALVWQAAAGLDPKQLSLLDLHLRQGLDSGEIADVMGVTKNNGYVMLNRLKKAVEDSIGAFIMFKDGRRYCDGLDSALGELAPGEMSPEIRKLVEKHVAQCELCEERKKKLVAPLAVFGAFALVGSPTGARAQILEHLMQQWPGPAAATGSAGGGLGQGAAALGGLTATGKVVKIFAGLGMAAAFLLAFLLVPASPIALTRSDGHKVVDAAAGDPPASPSPGDATPTATPTSATGANIISPSPSPSTTAGSAGSPSPAGGSPVSPPPLPGSPSPTTGPGTATATATAPPTATKAPPPTATPSPTPTSQPCTPSLSTNVSDLNASNGTNSFQVLNNACGDVGFSVFPSAQAAWLHASPLSGTLPPFGSTTVVVTADLQSLGEGTHTGTVLVSWTGGGVVVNIIVTKQGAAPVVNFVRQSCGSTSNVFSVLANVSDDFGVATVTLVYRLVGNSALHTVSLTFASGSATLGDWNFQGTGSLATFTVVATDAAGHNSAPMAGGC